MAVRPAAAADEARHQPGDEALWSESVYLDFFAPDGSLGGYVRFGLYPNLGVTWYWACLVGEGRPLVTVIEHEAPLVRGGGWELRAPGMWSELVVETPLDHVTVGLEAFAVAMDDPTEVYRSGRGDRVPFGLDLEWETDGGSFAYDITSRYEIPCRVHGEILVGEERIELDGWGQRDHSWGVRDWWAFEWCWSAGRLEDGRRFHGVVLPFPHVTGYVGRPGSLDTVTAGSATAELDGAGLARAGAVTLGDLVLTATPLAWAPVLLTAPDGRVSRFPRALTRFVDADGTPGLGWLELNQPVSAAATGL